MWDKRRFILVYKKVFYIEKKRLVTARRLIRLRRAMIKYIFGKSPMIFIMTLC